MFALALLFMLFAVSTMNVVLWVIAIAILITIIARRKNKATHRS